MITDRQKRLIRDTRRTGLSYEEIAGITGLPTNAVKSFCLRANIEFPEESEVAYNGCKRCGKQLQRKPGRKRKLFCSGKCRSEWWNHNRSWARRNDDLRLICRYCGAEFDSYGNRKREYCSYECYVSGRYAGNEGMS